MFSSDFSSLCAIRNLSELSGKCCCHVPVAQNFGCRRSKAKTADSLELHPSRCDCIWPTERVSPKPDHVEWPSSLLRPNLRVAKLVKSFGPPELAESLDDFRYGQSRKLRRDGILERCKGRVWVLCRCVMLRRASTPIGGSICHGTMATRLASFDFTSSMNSNSCC